MINSTLLNNWNGYDFGIKLDELANRPDWKWLTYNCYFFLRSELEVKDKAQWDIAKRAGKIRHCKIYRGRFLDYVVQKEFNTLEQWVADAGGRIEDVIYGDNRVNRHGTAWENGVHVWKPVGVPHYVELKILLKALGYVEPPKVIVPQVVVPTTTTQDLTEMINLEMRMRGLNVDNVWVIEGGNVTQWRDFMAQ